LDLASGANGPWRVPAVGDFGFIAYWDIGRVGVDTMYSRSIRSVGYDIICCTCEKAGAVSCWTTGLASKPSWALSVILVLIEGYSQYECSMARHWLQKYILLTKTNKSHCENLETENRIDATRIHVATCVRYNLQRKGVLTKRSSTANFIELQILRWLAAAPDFAQQSLASAAGRSWRTWLRKRSGRGRVNAAA
jgi:hypothetical protein